MQASHFQFRLVTLVQAVAFAGGTCWALGAGPLVAILWVVIWKHVLVAILCMRHGVDARRRVAEARAAAGSAASRRLDSAA